MKKSIGVAFSLALALTAASALVDFPWRGIVLAATVTPKAKALTVTGTIEKAGDDFIIRTGKTLYTIKGQDFSPLVGKKAKVTGRLLRTGDKKVLEVQKHREVGKKKK